LRNVAGALKPGSGLPRMVARKCAENANMLRTILSIGALALLGIILLRFVFGILVGFVGLALWLLILAVKVALVGLVVYFVIRIVSPDTARRLRERWSGR